VAVVHVDAQLLPFVVRQVHPAAHHLADFGDLALHLHGLAYIIGRLGEQRRQRHGLLHGERFPEFNLGGAEQTDRQSCSSYQTHMSIIARRGSRYTESSQWSAPYSPLYSSPRSSHSPRLLCPMPMAAPW